MEVENSSQQNFYIMAQITKESFLALSNMQMWELFSKSQIESKTFNELNTKLDLLIGKVTKMDAEMSVAKAVNVALQSEVTNLKRKLNQNNNYHRQENLELSGIPESVSDDNLEATAISILNKTGVALTSKDIVDCHRMRNKKVVIIRFVNRKNAQEALANSRSLQGNTNDIISNSVIYINRNLTPESMSLRWKAKLLKRANHIHDFGTNRRGVWVKSQSDGARKQIDVDEDLVEFLPRGISLSDICI